MSTPYPALVPPRSQAKKTSQGNQSLRLPYCQLCLSCISRAKLMAQGQPGMPPSDLEAELMTICGVDPRPPRYLAESEMPGPATYAVQSAWSRRDSTQSRGTMEDSSLGALALCKELRVPVADRCHVTQNSHRLSSPPGNEHGGAPGSKGCNLHISLE